MKKLDPTETDARLFYKFMIGAVAPRPIALVSTIDQSGRVNLSPFSFFNYVGMDPPIVVFAPNKKASDGSEKHTALNIKEVPEAVVNLVDFNLVQQVSLSSSLYDRGINEFEKAGFTPLASELIAPPRVAEALVQLECKILDIKEIGTMSLMIAEVVLAHVSEKILDSKGQIDILKTSWVGRSGGDWYNRSGSDTMFEVPRPQLGIGVNALPHSVQQSTILTGNDLGLLGSVGEIPNRDEIAEYANDPVISELRAQTRNVCENFNELLHIRVKELIVSGHLKEALLAAFQSH